MGVSEEDFIDGAPPLHMRRSVSDADNTDEIAKMLAAKQKSLGNMSLYFGCRRSDMDHIYRDEMKKAQVLGALTDVHVALSREPERPKVGASCSMCSTCIVGHVCSCVHS